MSPLDKKEASLPVMRRYHLFPILTFLTGLAVGFFATGGYGKPPEPAHTSTALEIADGRDGPDGTESTRLSTEEPTPAAALSATAEESVPVADDNCETAPELESRLQTMNTAPARLQAGMSRLRERVCNRGIWSNCTGTRESSDSTTCAPLPPREKAANWYRLGSDAETA